MIGLLGGSFDPVHHGHLIAGQALLEQLGLSELRFVPACDQPLKGGRHGAAAADRVAMVELAIQGERAASRSSGSRSSGQGRSYTVDTLRQLRAREPGARVRAPDRAPMRPGTCPTGARPRRCGDWRRWSPSAGRERPAESSPLVHRRVEVPAVDISSTEIRRRVAAGLSIRYWVPDAVATYIAERGLYRKTEA